MRKIYSSKIIILVLSVCGSVSFGSEDIIWPNKRSSIIEGDLYLAGFFPIHEIDNDLVCGRIEEEGLQQLETFMFTVDKINQDSSILANITLGVVGLDSCDSSSHVLEVGLDFMSGFLASDADFRETLSCKNNFSPTYNGIFKRLAGVIGGRSSRVSIQLANLLRIFKIPQVSYKSNAPSLSNKMKYEYFFRTVAPIGHQVQALLEIIKAFNWTYISVVYSDSAYGNAGFESLQVFASNENICFATQQRVNLETFKERNYDDVIDALIKERANAVVVFGEQLLAKQVMAASTRKGVLNRFVWLGSEAWGSRDYAVKDFQPVAEGTLCVAYIIKPPPGFFEYFRDRTPENTEEKNPWFYEFWERKKKCRLLKYPLTPYNQNYTEECSGNISDDLYMQKMPSAQLVRDAVYSLATALNNMHKDKCSGVPGLCQNMIDALEKDLRNYLYNVKFYDDNGNLFQFDEHGDAPPRYAIANYQRREGSNEYYWRPVGSFIKDGDSPAKLVLDASIMKFKHLKPDFPESVCSTPCDLGQTQVFLDSSPCCWACVNCTDYQYISDGECRECSKGSKSSWSKQSCEKIPEEYMNYRNAWAIGCIIIAIFGMLTAVAVSVVFWFYWDTPIIKASARELSVLLLLGVFFSFLLTFAIVSRPTSTTCAIVRFFLGFSYTVCYAAIVVKTRRIARIFERRGRRQKPKYTSPQSQLMIATAVISIEGVINATWLMYDLPSTNLKFPSRDRSILICSSSDSPAYLLGLLYPFLLMIVCTVYAFKTRKCPDGFNEARYITFANYTTCVIWLAFLPTFIIHHNNNVRTATLSLLLSSSAIVQIACLFVPKIYIAILHPQNNTKDIVMGYTSGTSSSTAST